MADTPELIAICYDEDYMCSRLHSDTSGWGHPEIPARLVAILDRLRSATIGLREYGKRDLMDFVRSYRCRPADLNTLYYCHSKRHVQQLVSCCRKIAKLNDDCKNAEGKGEGHQPFVSRYPLDEDTYLTSKSEKVARMAVGGIVRLVNVLMGKDVDNNSPSSTSRSVSSLSELTTLSDDLDTAEPVPELAESEGINPNDVVSKESDDVSAPVSERDESCTNFDATETDEAGNKEASCSQMDGNNSVDKLTSALETLEISPPMGNDISPTSVRKGFALLRPPGHHATPDKMMGFCLYNNVAIAAAHLQREFGLKRIAIVDIDVHHGNGTQDIFYDDSGVCFISIHRFGTSKHPFYPYTGNYTEVGGGKAVGTTVNIPLDAGYTTHDVVYAFQHVVLPQLELFRPEFILVSCGYDAAKYDYLGGCMVTPDCYGWIALELCRVAERYAKGRLLLALEGGYNPKVNADCTEAIFRTLLNYEVDRYFTVTCDYDSSKAKKGTITVCASLNELLKKSNATLNPTPSTTNSAYNERAGGVTLEWTEYPDGIDDKSFVLAGGHLNQFILPSNANRNELCKLCSQQEVEFYRWLYAINDKELAVIDKECPYLKLQFSNEEEDVYITGVRLVTDPSAAPTVKPCVTAAPVYQQPPRLDPGLDVVKDLIKYVIECSAIYTSRVFSDWNLQNSHENGIRMRNALYNMREPCVMDLKMGTRLYGDDVMDPKEIEQKERKASTRSSKSHGFHISGMFRWSRGLQKAVYLQEKLAYMLKQDEELVSAFSLYFGRIPNSEVACSVIDKLLVKLAELRSLFERQEKLAFYGTSLLFVFDAHASGPYDFIESANVYMIDLSHVSYNTGTIDSGYLLGLRTIIVLLSKVKEAITANK